jgi:hypothetical protein
VRVTVDCIDLLTGSIADHWLVAGMICDDSYRCYCMPGRFGYACEFDMLESQIPLRWTQKERACCASGVVSANGTCCVGSGNRLPQVDANGNCCDGNVDGCGVCNGKGVALDGQNKCCLVRSRMRCRTMSWHARRHYAGSSEACQHDVLSSAIGRLHTRHQQFKRFFL